MSPAPDLGLHNLRYIIYRRFSFYNHFFSVAAMQIIAFILSNRDSEQPSRVVSTTIGFHATPIDFARSPVYSLPLDFPTTQLEKRLLTR